MAHTDLALLQSARQWLEQGKPVLLFTVVQTAGSAPRPIGSLMVMSTDGLMAGSVSGGCVEQDLLERAAQGEWNHLPYAQLLVFGGTKEQAECFKLPCGSELKLIIEPLSWREVERLVTLLSQGGRVERTLNLNTHTAQSTPTHLGERFYWDGVILTRVWGVRWTALLIGANDLGKAVAQMGLLLDYRIVVCDPRVEYSSQWSVPDTELSTLMPDEAVLALGEYLPCSCVLAMTHDPKLDDMALMEALNTKAFYVGALGSKVASDRRRERLAQLNIDSENIAKLHAPIGLAIGSKTPAEIAVAIWGHITHLRRHT